ncbi:MAG: pseudouridine-5'-phosphate glycosidase, partial [Lachnospiraceae bacterium]|nr:pseudouridine-5'-phosphate glycosidase [Candidatus Equihabitans merdae]
MEVCRRKGVPMAISCGIGGIGDIKGEELCPDLPALRDLPVALLCTSPKDMLDIPGTIKWLTERGVHVAGHNGQDGLASCTGYIFHSIDLPLEESLSDYPMERIMDSSILDQGLLLLNPIPESKRITDLSILTKAVEVGKEAEANGRYYHPAVNGEIDRLTDGESSRIQLEGLVANIAYALSL